MVLGQGAVVDKKQYWNSADILNQQDLMFVDFVKIKIVGLEARSDRFKLFGRAPFLGTVFVQLKLYISQLHHKVLRKTFKKFHST